MAVLSAAALGGRGRSPEGRQKRTFGGRWDRTALPRSWPQIRPPDGQSRSGLPASCEPWKKNSLGRPLGRGFLLFRALVMAVGSQLDALGMARRSCAGMAKVEKLARGGGMKAVNGWNSGTHLFDYSGKFNPPTGREVAPRGRSTRG